MKRRNLFQTSVQAVSQLKVGQWAIFSCALILIVLTSYGTSFAEGQPDEAATTFTSPLPGPHDGEGHHNNELRELFDSLVDRDQLVADALGITVDELNAAREEGTHLHELIDELDLDEETVRQSIQAGIADAVEQAVEEGTITEEEAAALLNPPTREERGPRGDGEGNGEDNSEGNGDGNGEGENNGGRRRHGHERPTDENAADSDSSDSSDETTDDATSETTDTNSTDENTTAAADNNTTTEERPTRQERAARNSDNTGNQRRGR